MSPAIWIKCALPGVALPSNMTPFELQFGRKPRTSLDSVVPLSEETGHSSGLHNYLERHKQNLREVRLTLEKRYNRRVPARSHANAAISRTSGGVPVEKGCLVLVRESESSTHRDNRRRKLPHDHYKGPWRVTEVLQTGLSAQVTMRGTRYETTHPKCIQCRRDSIPSLTSDPEILIRRRISVFVGPGFEYTVGNGREFVL